jgi:hypothetical protein
MSITLHNGKAGDIYNGQTRNQNERMWSEDIS